MSMWALSSENIKSRTPKELATIYELAIKKIPPLVEKLIKNNIRFETVGDLWLVPPNVREVLLDAIIATKKCSKMTFILAIGYG